MIIVIGRLKYPYKGFLVLPTNLSLKLFHPLFFLFSEKLTEVDLKIVNSYGNLVVEFFTSVVYI